MCLGDGSLHGGLHPDATWGAYSTGGANRCVTQAWSSTPQQTRVWGESNGMGVRGSLSPVQKGQVLQRVGLTSHSWPQGELGCRWNGPHLTSLPCFLPVLPAGKLGHRWPDRGSESKAPFKLVSKTSLENVQGRLYFCKRASARHR